MACRILHCGKSLTNYYLCLEEGVAGFLARKEAGDLVYFAVKVDRGTLCGAKARLAKPTDRNPWASDYPYRFTLAEIEFCSPIDMAILKPVGGPHYAAKYFQGSKPIKDPKVLRLLEDTFVANKTNSLVRL